MCRALVLRVLAVYGDEEVKSEARSRFEKHLSGEKPVPADLRSAVFIFFNSKYVFINDDLSFLIGLCWRSGRC